MNQSDPNLSAVPQSRPEPWLRGTHPELPALARAVLHALELTAEDAHRWTDSFTDAEYNLAPKGLPSLGWQMRHIARSIDRLLTYAEGLPLSPVQLAELRREGQTGTAADLHAELRSALLDATSRILTLATFDPQTPRTVGRKALPTTVGGLLVHVADHTQRHTGQLVTTAKFLRAQR